METANYTCGGVWNVSDQEDGFEELFMLKRKGFMIALVNSFGITKLILNFRHAALQVINTERR